MMEMVFERPIIVKEIENKDGETIYIATIYDLMTSQYGVRRLNHPLEASSYEDENSMYSPKWQEKVTGVKSSIVTQVEENLRKMQLIQMVAQ